MNLVLPEVDEKGGFLPVKPVVVDLSVQANPGSRLPIMKKGLITFTTAAYDENHVDSTATSRSLEIDVEPFHPHRIQVRFPEIFKNCLALSVKQTKKCPTIMIY